MDARLVWARAKAPGLASISIHTDVDMVAKVVNSHRLRAKPASPCSWFRATTMASADPDNQPITAETTTLAHERRAPIKRPATMAMRTTPAMDQTRRHPVNRSEI